MQGELTIHRLLLKMTEVQASDLHIKVGGPPVLRIAAELHPANLPALSGEETKKLLMPLVPPRLLSQLDESGGVDFAHTDEGSRFRCSIFRAGGGLHAAIRRVSAIIPDFLQLNLPPIYEQAATRFQEGLVIICGVTGSGKSSTLAAIVDHINSREALNIITIEDPVEYLFTSKMSIISQREVGLDVSDFATAMRTVVRQDPDVILVGEMRDKATLLAGLMAAETGHLVYATLHTADTMQSFGRILEFFPIEEHGFVRSCLSNGLKAVMAQRLLPSCKPGISVVPATEVLLNTPVTATRIREGRDEDIPAIIAGSAAEGMHSFTDSLLRLVDEELVTVKVAEQYAPSVDQFHSRIRNIDIKADSLISRIRK